MVMTHCIGFPRIGSKRQTKFTVESYWRGDISQAELFVSEEKICLEQWQFQQEAGLDFVSVGDFSWYDTVLQTSLLLGIVPKRFLGEGAIPDIDTLFCMARGKAPNGMQQKPCELTKWFDTNYHYIVPEFTEAQTFSIVLDHLFNQVERAKKSWT